MRSVKSDINEMVRANKLNEESKGETVF